MARIVVALGGNALAPRGEPAEVERQRSRVAHAALPLAELARGNELVITHGNGPQIGLLALQAESLPGASPVPLDALGAQTEGSIGYLIAQELEPHLDGREVVALLTRAEVSSSDPAFDAPAKPIGPVYPADARERLARERGWHLVRDGEGVRRVVPSPAPVRILELRAVRLLLEAGHVVIAAGGGGIPVARTPGGEIRGVEAVVDKDHASALLAAALDADWLVLLTDVGAVWTRWPPPAGHPIRHASPAELSPGRFEAGTMSPKVEAACAFVRETGARAAIGALDQLSSILEGNAGTLIDTDGKRGLELYPQDG